jgi:hypothetical protein
MRRRLFMDARVEHCTAYGSQRHLLFPNCRHEIGSATAASVHQRVLIVSVLIVYGIMIKPVKSLKPHLKNKNKCRNETYAIPRGFDGVAVAAESRCLPQIL